MVCPDALAKAVSDGTDLWRDTRTYLVAVRDTSLLSEKQSPLVTHLLQRLSGLFRQNLHVLAGILIGQLVGLVK